MSPPKKDVDKVRLPAAFLGRRLTKPQIERRPLDAAPEEELVIGKQPDIIEDIPETIPPADEPVISAPPEAEPLEPPAAKLPPRPKKPRRSFSLKNLGRFERLTLPAWPIRRNLWLAVVITLLILSSQLTLLIQPQAGVYANAVVLFVLLFLALRQERARQLLISVAIIPTAMLVGLSLPAAQPLARMVTLGVVILLLAMVYRFLFTLDYPVQGSRLRMTRHGYTFAIPLMIVAGQAIGLLGFGLLFKDYQFRAAALPLVFLTAPILAAAEEMLFRGLIQQRAMLLFHPIVAAVLSAVLFTTLTFGLAGSVAYSIVGGILGSVTALTYYRKQNVLLTFCISAAAKLTYLALIAVFILR